MQNKIDYETVTIGDLVLSHHEVYEFMSDYFNFLSNDLVNATEIRLGRILRKDTRNSYLISRYDSSPSGYRTMNLVPLSEAEMIFMLRDYFDSWKKEDESDDE